MTLEFALQQYPFRMGLAEGTDPHQVPPGTLTEALNVVWKQSGRLEKRFGISALAASIVGGGSVSAGARLFCRGSELCLIDGTNLYAYAASPNAWRTVGKVPNVGVTTAPLVDSTSGIQTCCSAIGNGYRVDAWVTGDNSSTGNPLFVQVIDEDGGVAVAPTRIVTSGAVGVRVLVIGTTAIIVTQTNTSANITAFTVDLTSLAISGATNLRTDCAATSYFDACVIGSNFVIGYTSTAPALKLYSYNASFVQQATGGITSEASGTRCIGIDGADGEVLYVIYDQNIASPSPVKIAMANANTLVQTVAPVTIETPAGVTSATQVAVCRYNSTSCIAAYNIFETPTLLANRTTTYQVTNAGSVTTSTQRGTYNASLVSRPFMFGGACYLVLSDFPNAIASAPSDRTTVLVEAEVTARTSAFTTHRYVASIDPLIGGHSPVPGASPPGVAVESATLVHLPTPFQSTTQVQVTRQGMRITSLSLGADVPADMWRTVSYGQETYVSAGLLAAYDGRSVFDYGFVRAPAFYSFNQYNGAGSMTLGTYLYGATLEYRSATGLLYRSPTQTAGGTVTLTGVQDTVDIIALGYNLSLKQNTTTLFGSNAALPTLLPWYRTTVGGTTYQRLTVEPTYNVTLVSQLSESAAFTDTRPDSSVGNQTLASRPALYTTGGIKDDYAPPGGVTMFTHVDRLWVLANDQKTWWYSKSFQDDLGVAPGFHPDFRITFDDVQTAGATMDNKAVLFGATGVSYMEGVGPNAFGLQSDFQVPSVIQSDVGCTNARSVVGTPDGIMFLSARGIYLLSRGLELVWIGRPIKETLAAYPNITSATLVAKHNQVRFTANNNEGTGGIVLVFDYVEKQWSTFKYNDGASAIYGCAIADACMWNGAWTFVTPSGVVFVESSTSYLDGANYVPSTIETAWISASGPLAYQSIRNFELHGTSYTDHDLTIECGFDSDPTYTTPATFPAECPVTSVGDLIANVTIGNRRKCGSIRFRIRDATPTTGTLGIGRGPAFDMMGIEVGMKRGFQAAGATRKG